MDAYYDIQFGHVKRPTHRNTSWDAAKYVCFVFLNNSIIISFVWIRSFYNLSLPVGLLNLIFNQFC